MKILDVRCGVNKHEGAIGLDNNPPMRADVIQNLCEIPCSFPDNEFGLIVSNQVIEHVSDVLSLNRRTAQDHKPGGHIKPLTPR